MNTPVKFHEPGPAPMDSSWHRDELRCGNCIVVRVQRDAKYPNNCSEMATDLISRFLVGDAEQQEPQLRRIYRLASFAALTLLACVAESHAMTKYNPFTRQWEQVSPDAVPRMNPATGQWELASPNAVLKLNPFTKQYHLVPPDSVPR